MAIDTKLIDQLLADYKKPEEIIGEKRPPETTHQSHPRAGDASGA